MIGHHSKAEDFDAHDAGQKFESVANPLSSIFKVGTADGIFAAQESTSDASIDAKDDADFVVRANLLSLSSGHIGPSHRKGPLVEDRTVRHVLRQAVSGNQCESGKSMTSCS